MAAAPAASASDNTALLLEKIDSIFACLSTPLHHENVDADILVSDMMAIAKELDTHFERIIQTSPHCAAQAVQDEVTALESELREKDALLLKNSAKIKEWVKRFEALSASQREAAAISMADVDVVPPQAP